MKNITLAIDADVLAKVRRIAAEKNTTVNAMVREALARIANQDDEARKATEEFLRLTEDSDMVVGPIRWTRDDLYGR